MIGAEGNFWNTSEWYTSVFIEMKEVKKNTQHLWEGRRAFDTREK